MGKVVPGISVGVDFGVFGVGWCRFIWEWLVLIYLDCWIWILFKDYDFLSQAQSLAHRNSRIHQCQSRNKNSMALIWLASLLPLGRYP